MGNRIAVLNIPIDAVTMSEAVAQTEAFIVAKTPHLIATANAEMVMLAKEDEELAVILRSADLVVPDGAGVVWAASHLGQPVPERVAGYDLAQNLMAVAAKKGYRLYFLGGGPGVAAKAKATAQCRYPGVSIVGLHDGYFSEKEEASILAEIAAQKTDILFVALGVPKQEKWLAKNLSRLQVPVAIGVGGTFDVMAGIVKRAPLWMQRAKLEWLFRLLCQPSRALRMMALPRFVWKVIFHS